MDRSACTFVASSLENQARLESLGSPKANRQSLSRLRCVSFPTSAQLKSYLNGLKEAAESDHRAIGKAQALFLTHESSPGTPFILPNGMKIARKMERVIRDLYDQNEYQEVQSPQLYRSSLWKTSGHWDNYRDDMFCSEGYKERSERSRSSSAWMEKAKVAEEVDRERGGCCSAHSEKASSSSEPKREEGREKEEQDEESFGLKPMNCPGHCLIFSSQTRSYRDLPIRFAEFSPLHRNESSGSLSGLTRVRRFHQDDAHVFCTPSQISGEIAKMLEMLSSAYETFGFRDFELALSTRPATNFIGEEEEWERAEEALRKALDGTGRVWEVNRGDGAFYGPKIDIRLVDSAGRKHQTATIQLDFQLPRRFELSYLDRDGETKVPVMIHRAILGSVERFMAILIESTAGFWPFWINPLQAVILPTNHDPEVKLFAEKVRHLLSLGDQADLLLHSLDERVETLGLKRRNLQKLNVDLWTGSDRTLSKSVRKAQMQRYNFIIFVGPKEVEQGRVTLRMRQEPSGGGGGGGVKSEFKAWLRSKIESGHTFSPKELRDIFCFMDSCHI
ncbi:threonyl-tRNA synthetase [Violaceomyces palustris]|uniref:Threonyl-tRNA synthetase n=1 Tax=Violaceomyces palustris TaxID=1673888 RepID=A0ACD0P2R7_9BASI|nr:threonyl-tRNA synthetase [Violaceomyces palustris]